jgi:hypothetical protein
MKPRGPIPNPDHASLTIAPDPLRRTLPAERELGHGLLQAQPAPQNILRKLLSTNNRQSHDNDSSFGLLRMLCFANSASLLAIEWTTSY